MLITGRLCAKMCAFASLWCCTVLRTILWYVHMEMQLIASNVQLPNSCKLSWKLPKHSLQVLKPELKKPPLKHTSWSCLAAHFSQSLSCCAYLSGYYMLHTSLGEGEGGGGTEFWELESFIMFNVWFISEQDNALQKKWYLKHHKFNSSSYFMLFFSGFFLALVSVKINISVN